MSQQIEMEVKVLLNYKAYVRLLRYFKLEKAVPVVQTNYYFDTPDFKLTNLQAALRIRFLDNKYTLTLKTLVDEGRLEINESIPKSLFTNMIENKKAPEKGEVFDKLKELGISTSDLRYVNCLTTKRLEFPYMENGKEVGFFCIDVNTYGDYVDYELEFEGKSIRDAKRVVTDIMGKIDMPFAYNELTKIERVFNMTLKA